MRQINCFEYLACGLDIWYPKEMIGVKKYRNDETPRVVEIDYSMLDTLDLENILPSSNKRAFENKYLAENIYQSYWNKLEER